MLYVEYYIYIRILMWSENLSYLVPLGILNIFFEVMLSYMLFIYFLISINFLKNVNYYQHTCFISKIWIWRSPSLTCHTNLFILYGIVAQHQAPLASEVEHSL